MDTGPHCLLLVLPPKSENWVLHCMPGGGGGGGGGFQFQGGFPGGGFPGGGGGGMGGGGFPGGQRGGGGHASGGGLYSEDDAVLQLDADSFPSSSSGWVWLVSHQQ